jgi:hypothetical protein
VSGRDRVGSSELCEPTRGTLNDAKIIPALPRFSLRRSLGSVVLEQFFQNNKAAAKSNSEIV